MPKLASLTGADRNYEQTVPGITELGREGQDISLVRRQRQRRTSPEIGDGTSVRRAHANPAACHAQLPAPISEQNQAAVLRQVSDGREIQPRYLALLRVAWRKRQHPASGDVAMQQDASTTVHVQKPDVDWHAGDEAYSGGIGCRHRVDRNVTGTPPP